MKQTVWLGGGLIEHEKIGDGVEKRNSFSFRVSGIITLGHFPL